MHAAFSNTGSEILTTVCMYEELCFVGCNIMQSGGINCFIRGGNKTCRLLYVVPRVAYSLTLRRSSFPKHRFTCTE